MQKYHNPEIERFELDALLYKVFLFRSGEARFTVTGDNIRLGILTKEDLLWDYTFDLPAIQSTDEVVTVHSHSLRVLRRVTLRYAQYISKHQPFFVFYQMPKDPRIERICLRLLEHHMKLSEIYEATRDEDSRRVAFTRKSNPSTSL